LSRYFTWQNFLSPFNVLIGILQAYFLLRRLKPSVLFSKGGFVAFPVVVGAWLNRIPVIAHESDLTPGLANRLSFPFVDMICVTFLAAKNHFKNKDKVVVTGTPIRDALLHGDRLRGLALCGFDEQKPCLLVMGGGAGSVIINQCIHTSLGRLCEAFQVIHLCGRGKMNPDLSGPGYCQFEYADETLPDLFAASDLIISRAGANALYEILALQKLHILIPLSRRMSRGDQIQNAAYFEQQGISVVVAEELLTETSLFAAIEDLTHHRQDIIARMAALDIQSSTQQIVALLTQLAQS
jgi:UDP-N-acetylglucosamine--N-acetylmuramyl-(pentapeptide) pyrophosphoryl-undecaprenol N-acetylglucosamine transferase